MPLGHLYKFVENIKQPDQDVLARSGNLMRNKEDGKMYYWDDSQTSAFSTSGAWIDWDRDAIPKDFERVKQEGALHPEGKLTEQREPGLQGHPQGQEARSTSSRTV
eukprot:m.137117 g.137117  ORF g.137117 m.137117 type:complete len:106 (+) comp15885_c0_seq1:675-992(+)